MKTLVSKYMKRGKETTMNQLESTDERGKHLSKYPNTEQELDLNEICHCSYDCLIGMKLFSLFYLQISCYIIVCLLLLDVCPYLSLLNNFIINCES